MFYTTDKYDHGLPYDPLKAIVAPRPIGWITSISARGEVNLAPYSYFNAVSTRPPIVCFPARVAKTRSRWWKRPASSCATSRPGTCATP